MRHFLFLIFALVFAGCGGSPESNSTAQSQPKEIQITEWLVPWENSRPRDPYVAPDGRVWFVGQRSHYAAVFDPATKEFTKFDLEDGAGPHNIIVDAQGNPWYTGNLANHIGKINPQTGEITKYMMPDERSARDPHTLVFGKGTTGWFTSQGVNSVGKFDFSTGKATIMPVPTPRARPYGIMVDATGERPWIVLFGTNKLATVDPGTTELKEIELPNEGIRPRRLAITDDGMIWVCDYARGYLGRYNPDNGAYDEWAMPSGEASRPYSMASDDKGRIWLTETGVQPNNFVGFDPQTESFFFNKPLESGGGTVRHMVYHKETNSIWFATDTNYLGRATLN